MTAPMTQTAPGNEGRVERCETCASCRFFRFGPTAADPGACRRYAPRAVQPYPIGSKAWACASPFPAIDCHDWCGEYQRREG